MATAYTINANASTSNTRSAPCGGSGAGFAFIVIVPFLTGGSGGKVGGLRPMVIPTNKVTRNKSIVRAPKRKQAPAMIHEGMTEDVEVSHVISIHKIIRLNRRFEMQLHVKH